MEAEKIICEGMTATKSAKCISCQTEQWIFDTNVNVMIYENGGGEQLFFDRIENN